MNARQPVQRRQRQTTREMETAYIIVTNRDNNRCQRCLRGCGNPTRDHRQNRDGYNTVPSNLQLLGGSGTTGCHGWKTSHPQLAEQEGWSCPSWAIPSEFPARRWLPTARGTVRPAWVLYDDNGSWREIDEEEARRRQVGDWPGVSRAAS